jgi:PmbA protein
MNQEMHDLAQWSIQTVKSAGANECRVRIQSQRFVEISYRKRRPENIKEASQRGLEVEIYVNGRYSSQSTSDLRKDALKDFLANAVTATKLLAEDPYRTLPDPRYYEGRAPLDLGIRDAAYEAFAPSDRHTLVKAVEDACLEKGGPKVISVTAGQYDGHSEEVVLTSNGFEGYRASTIFGAGAEVTMQDEGDRRPNGYYAAASVKRKGLPAPQEIGALAATRTLDLLGARKIKTETMPIIVENQNVGRILSGLLSAMSGRNIQQKQSFLADKKGQKIASEHLTLIDDPLLVGGLGSRLFDGDGLAAKKRTMIDSGVLKDFFVDWYYSRKLNWEPTTSGSSNLIVPPGKRSVPEIMKDLGRGILITGFIGGNSNSTTGDSSVGILGKLFEKGEPTQAVAEMNIAGNHLQFWPKLVEVANDPWPYSAMRTPSLVFTDVVVSGV